MTIKTHPRHSDLKGKSLFKHKLVSSLVARAASNTGFDKNKFKSRNERYTDQLKENIKVELDELDMIHWFTTQLVEVNHPDPVKWMFEVIQSKFETGPGTWKKQIHLFSTRWIMWLTRLEHATGIDTHKVRVALAAEEDAFRWLGNLEQLLVPLVMDNNLFMTEEQVLEIAKANLANAAANDGTKAFEIGEDGKPVQVALTPTDLAVVSGQAPV